MNKNTSDSIVISSINKSSSTLEDTVEQLQYDIIDNAKTVARNSSIALFIHEDLKRQKKIIDDYSITLMNELNEIIQTIDENNDNISDSMNVDLIHSQFLLASLQTSINVYKNEIHTFIETVDKLYHQNKEIVEYLACDESELITQDNIDNIKAFLNEIKFIANTLIGIKSDFQNLQHTFFNKDLQNIISFIHDLNDQYQSIKK